MSHELDEIPDASADDRNLRRVRPTIRCLDDLGLDVPARSVRIDEIDHQVLDKARSLAPMHPENQVRIQAIQDTLVFRFTHGRHRAITWHDSDSNILWVCAVDLRRENEGYDSVLDLHAHGNLLPRDDDARRLEDEAILELAHAIRDGAPLWVDDARANPNIERRYELPGGATVRMYFNAEGGTGELWAALPTLLSSELGLPDTARALAVAAITEALGADETVWEQRHEWPTGPLQHFEVAFFWLT